MSQELVVKSPQDFDVDSIAVSVLADIFIELTNIRRQDPNNYSDTVTRCLVQMDVDVEESQTRWTVSGENRQHIFLLVVSPLILKVSIFKTQLYDKCSHLTAFGNLVYHNF